MFQSKLVEEIKTHILCSVTFFLENRAGYEITWKNIAERGRPQMAIGACALHARYYLRLQIQSLTIYNTYCFSTATVVARTCLNITLNVHCLSCLVFSANDKDVRRKTHYITCLPPFVCYNSYFVGGWVVI